MNKNLRITFVLFGLLCLVVQPCFAADPVLNPVPSAPFPLDADVFAVTTGDFNGDGKPDVVAGTRAAGLTLLLGDGTGTFTVATNSPLAPGLDLSRARNVRLFDINADGALDILTGGAQGVTIFLNNGTGQFSEAVNSPVSTVPGTPGMHDAARFVFIGDMNSDGKPDLIVNTGINGNYASILLGDGAGGFTVATGSPFQCQNGGIGSDMAMDDLNGDGIPDLVNLRRDGAGIIVPNITIFFGNGAGALIQDPASPFLVGEDSANSLALGDLNGDGARDILNGRSDGNSNSNRFGLAFNDGSGGYTPATGPLSTFVNSLRIADMNGDGFQDFVSAGGGFNPWFQIFLGDGLGGFTEATGSPVLLGTGNVRSMHASDLNQDGKNDLVLAIHSTAADSLLVYLNQTPVTFPPNITSPLTAGGWVGQAFSYTIEVDGSAPFTYSTGTLPAGLTLSGNTISGTPVAATQTSVVLTATNAAGVDMETLSITIQDGTNQPPVLNAGPDATPSTISPGNTVAFSVTASDPDGDTLQYSWSFGDGGTSTQQNPSHPFDTIGQYSVTVTVTDGKGGSAIGSVLVNVSDGSNAPPQILSGIIANPNPVVNANSAQLQALALDPDNGPLAMKYNWSLVSGPGTIALTVNNSNFASQTTATFGASGDYRIRVIVSDGANADVAEILLNVSLPGSSGTAPSIVSHPSNAAVTAGQTATFSVTASGTAPLTYQWQKNGTDIPGAVASAYTTPVTTVADNGALYRVVVSNAHGAVTSNAATLTVSGGGGGPIAPAITSQPASQTIAEGNAVTFSVSVSGTAPFTYQWQRNGSNLPGATGSSHVIAAVTAGDDGATFRVVVTNAAGTVTSNNATLTVTTGGTPPPPPPSANTGSKAGGCSLHAGTGMASFTLLGWLTLACFLLFALRIPAWKQGA